MEASLPRADQAEQEKQGFLDEAGFSNHQTLASLNRVIRLSTGVAKPLEI
jgi:hypothetical protein